MTGREVADGVRQGWQSGMLNARPGGTSRESFAAGLHWLGAEDRSAALLVPPRLPAGPVPLVVLLHGATSNPRQALPYLQDEARQRGFLLLAPKSQDYTWDVIRGGFGPDVGPLDLVLDEVFERFAVDRARLAIAGFSDGASYALSLGLVNGDLFTHVLAYSPGFVVSGPRPGRPKIFVSHGISDHVLPIDRCSRRIVPVLREDGYDVDYREFDGGHELRADLVAAATDQLMA
ncbi:alpha/beta hydrolase [Kribbella orskensis]|uniref:alpha/beta hydrolase n=1 Tax=Kribbella orskensis TaxID=2512216 RepID=UPI001F53E69C|nr:phospholipase [Kribbella orskensis]